MMLRFLPAPWLTLKPLAAFPAASARPLTLSAILHKTQFPPRPKPPPDSELEISYLKGSGPGGQKINKTNSAVQIKHIPTGIVVKCQATRSQSQNRKEAKEILARNLDDLLHGDQSRSAIKGEIKRKRAASSAKKSRRKYRKLEEEQSVAEENSDSLPAEEDSTPEPSKAVPESTEETTNGARKP